MPITIYWSSNYTMVHFVVDDFGTLLRISTSPWLYHNWAKYYDEL